MKKRIATILLNIIAVFFGWGLYTMWTSEFSFSMCLLFTALGAIGLLWIAIIVYDNYYDK